MTVTQAAPARMPRGMPLSGVAMISFMTAWALVSRSLILSLSSCAKPGSVAAKRVRPQSIAVIDFMGSRPFVFGFWCLAEAIVQLLSPPAATGIFTVSCTMCRRGNELPREGGIGRSGDGADEGDGPGHEAMHEVGMGLAGKSVRRKMGAARVVQLALRSLVAPLPGLCCPMMMGLPRWSDNSTKDPRPSCLE